MMRSSKTVSAILLFLGFLLIPVSASALDIPLLTWERGKEQNLVLGGNVENEWKIELVNEANEKVLDFKESEISANGFRVYSVSIPDDFPLGAYAVRATGIGIPGSIVAGVNIVGLSFYEVTQIPFELLWIFLAYVFVTSSYAVMRIRNHGSLRVPVFEDFDIDVVSPRLATLHRLREKATSNLEPSLFQLLLQREGGWLRLRSHVLWSAFPILSLLLGGAIGIQILREGGFGKALWLWLFFGAAIAFVDLYSAIIAFVGFVFSHLIFGDVVSLREVMVLLAVGLGWCGSYALASIVELLHERGNAIDNSIQTLGVSQSWQGRVLAAFVSGAVFHGTQILVLSLVITVSEPKPTSWQLSVAFALGTLLRLQLRGPLESSAAISSLRLESKPVGRVIAGKTTAFLLLFFIGTIYIWVRDWLSAIALGFALTAPYALLLIRFAGPKFSWLLKVPRSALIEAFVVTGFAYGVFRALEDMPFEVLERSRLFLIVGVIPVLLHSLYSALWDVADRASSRSIQLSDEGSKL